MYVCVLRLYVHMYLCMCVWMNEWMNEWNEWMNEWMNEWTNERQLARHFQPSVPQHTTDTCVLLFIKTFILAKSIFHVTVKKRISKFCCWAGDSTMWKKSWTHKHTHTLLRGSHEHTNTHTHCYIINYYKTFTKQHNTPALHIPQISSTGYRKCAFSIFIKLLLI